MSGVDEAEVEEAALGWLADLGWTVVAGADLISDDGSSERADHSAVVLEERLRSALARLNPELPTSARDDAFRRLTQPVDSTLEARNRSIHQMLTNGVAVEFAAADGSTRGGRASLIDFDHPHNNDWLAVRQMKVTEGEHRRRLDIALFVNGLPLGIVELKSPTNREATLWSAWQQLQTYKSELPTLFAFNEVLIVSDGVEARIGTLTAGREWFKAWRTIDGDQTAEAANPQLEVLLGGVCAPERLCSLIRDFVVFDDDGSGRLVKKLAGYHQFHAVEVAVGETLRAAGIGLNGGRPDASEAPVTEQASSDDGRVGVVWHTQGSGKSLTMAFYAGRIIREPAMGNPTIVVLTDRNDLDDQLFATFARCSDLLRQPPAQAESRSDLRAKLSVASGGVVFTTIQKFFPDEQTDRHPLLSERRNIVVIADEAHRSQYDFIDGFARHMRDALPNASFIGFTGTPIEQTDANTRAVFGNYISVYDIQRAVEDQATVPIYYESRLAELSLDPDQQPAIDADFEAVTEGEELAQTEKLKTKWAALEAVVGTPSRITLVAADIVEHFESRLDVMDGKAMVVCMSRRICVDLYDELVRLRPSWHSDDDASGEIKVVMTGSAEDPAVWQRHIRSKSGRELLANRFRDPDDSFRIVLVRDMWLTGFDAPSLHTMYIDKPMRGHGLMQAIARVNRVFRDKPGGLVVDYLGLAHELRQALAAYTRSGGKGEAIINRAAAVAAMREKHDVCLGIMHGFDWSVWTKGTPTERLALLPAGQEHVLAQSDGKNRFTHAVRELSQAFALAVPDEAAIAIRDDIGFFQAVRSRLMQRSPDEERTRDNLDHAVRQIISRAVASGEVTDIFEAAGLDKPDISILSEEFLAEVRGMPHRNLAVELLQKLLRSEVRQRQRRNVTQGRSFAAMLAETISRYQSRGIEAAQIIEELIELARELREADQRGEQLGLTDDELAFYDALETNDSAVAVLGDETLQAIARELVTSVRNSVTIDWTLRENVRAGIRVKVKRILKRHGYPPDKQERAIQTVLEQAEALSADWAVD